MRSPLPRRKLREHPDLAQLKRQAKELLAAFRSGDAGATEEVAAHYRDADALNFALHDAQLVLARSYGYESWPKLKAFVDGVTAVRLAEAVRANDTRRVRAMLKARPELVGMETGGEYRALHYAVLERLPGMVRVLMEQGADARRGIYPHRDATSAFTIATERGYGEIVAIIEEEEERRRRTPSDGKTEPAQDALLRAIESGDDERALAMMAENPGWIETRHTALGRTLLDVAAQSLNPRVVAWLLDHGASATARGPRNRTPLDLAAYAPVDGELGKFVAVAELLRRRRSGLSDAAAVALGEADWLRARHAGGLLDNVIEPGGGLLRIAVTHERSEILALLLEFGFDPDERTRIEDADEVRFTWGMPLYHCAGSGKYAMAEMLLRAGADPNGKVYASGDPVFQAYQKRDWPMVDLLVRYGGAPQATTAGLFRQTELARKMLAGEADFRLEGLGGDTLAEDLLWGAACGGDAETVRMALERVEWPRDDPRWFHILEQPLRIWNHGPGMPDNPEWDRGTYITCFRLILERADPNVGGRAGDRGQFGLTILHSVAGARPHVRAGERVTFATLLLEAGARLDLRDNLLKSTPLGWACRWGRTELVKLLLEWGADPVESDADPWATPRAWAEKSGHADLVALLGRGRKPPES